MRRILIPLLTLTSLCAEPDFRLQPVPAKLMSPAINEASGLAVSPKDADFLWIVNDSGGTTEIHLVNTDGTARGSVSVEGTANRDWEDLAAFSLDGKPYLLIADIGDNGSARKFCTLYIVAEPSLPAEGKNVSGKAPAAWKINFTYEDGPRDCEAIAVDAADKKIILINKRTAPPVVYELALRPDKNPTARRIATTETKATGLTLPISFRNQPTGMDISADGSMAVLATYHGAFLFRKKNAETWSDAFARKAKSLGPHGLQQAESVAFAPDGKSIYLVSEGKTSPIVRFGRTK
ncbi:MAG: hypothetical protein N2A42_00275 [Luteolibacter sp.]